jgi:hypothetical protein
MVHLEPVAGLDTGSVLIWVQLAAKLETPQGSACSGGTETAPVNCKHLPFEFCCIGIVSRGSGAKIAGEV